LYKAVQSLTFYGQLLRLQILNAQKDSHVISVFIALLGPMRLKASRKMLVILLPGEGLVEEHVVLGSARAGILVVD